MAVYQGVVHEGVVVLPEGVHLADGLEVEIHTRVSASDADDDESREELFRQRLRDAGLLLDTAPREPIPPEQYAERRPIVVRGKPLSQMVIEERR